MTNTTTAAGSPVSDETATRIRDAVKTIAHWDDQERRDREEAARLTAAADTAEEGRRYHLTTRINTHTQRADGAAASAASKRETLAALLTVTVALPGAFCDFFDGTNLAQGLDNSDPECAATHAAWTDATHRRYGRHGYTMTITTSDMTVLNILDEYAGNCLESNADDPDPREVKAARETLARVKAARAQLRALTTLAREEQAAEEAHRAADAASLAAYSEKLLASLPTAPQAAEEAEEAPQAQEAPQEDQEAAEAFDETDPATWYAAPQGYEFREIDAETGELHLFAPDGRNLSTAHEERRAAQQTPQRPTADYPAHNTQGRCTHGYTCRYNRPEGTPGEWIHPDADRTPCTATPTMHVKWTGTVKGHHHATVTLPGGRHARITYIPRGTTHTFIGRASMGIGSPIVARAMSLSTLLHRYAQMSGYQTFTFEEYGTPDRPATAADYTTA